MYYYSIDILLFSRTYLLFNIDIVNLDAENEIPKVTRPYP